MDMMTLLLRSAGVEPEKIKEAFNLLNGGAEFLAKVSAQWDTMRADITQIMVRTASIEAMLLNMGEAPDGDVYDAMDGSRLEGAPANNFLGPLDTPKEQGYWECDCGRECSISDREALGTQCRAVWKDISPPANQLLLTLDTER